MVAHGKDYEYNTLNKYKQNNTKHAKKDINTDVVMKDKLINLSDILQNEAVPMQRKKFERKKFKWMTLHQQNTNVEVPPSRIYKNKQNTIRSQYTYPYNQTNICMKKTSNIPFPIQNFGGHDANINPGYVYTDTNFAVNNLPDELINIDKYAGYYQSNTYNNQLHDFNNKENHNRALPKNFNNFIKDEYSGPVLLNKTGTLEQYNTTRSTYPLQSLNNQSLLARDPRAPHLYHNGRSQCNDFYSPQVPSGDSNISNGYSGSNIRSNFENKNYYIHPAQIKSNPLVDLNNLIKTISSRDLARVKNESVASVRKVETDILDQPSPLSNNNITHDNGPSSACMFGSNTVCKNSTKTTVHPPTNSILLSEDYLKNTGFLDECNFLYGYNNTETQTTHHEQVYLNKDNASTPDLEIILCSPQGTPLEINYTPDNISMQENAMDLTAVSSRTSPTCVEELSNVATNFDNNHLEESLEEDLDYDFILECTSSSSELNCIKSLEETKKCFFEQIEKISPTIKFDNLNDLKTAIINNKDEQEVISEYKIEKQSAQNEAGVTEKISDCILRSALTSNVECVSEENHLELEYEETDLKEESLLRQLLNNESYPVSNSLLVSSTKHYFISDPNDLFV